jgi:diacylglycerol kinase family enzyme
VERRAQLKRWAGHPLFVFSAFTTWFRHYERDEPRFRVGATPSYFAIVLNTNPYTYLGNRPLDLVPEATLDRGLAVVTFRTLGFGPLVRAVGSALAGSDIRRHRALEVRTDLGELLVEGPRPFPYQVDGDFLGEVERLELRHVPAALRLVLPG